jgi:hypothetical protein
LMCGADTPAAGHRSTAGSVKYLSLSNAIEERFDNTCN